MDIDTGLAAHDVMTSFTPEQLAPAAGAFLHWREQSESPDLTGLG